MSKQLSEGIKNQVRAMSAGGKSAREIRDFVDQTYKTKIGLSTIYILCKGIKKSRRGGDRRGRRKEEKPIEETSIEGIFQDILKLIPEIQDGCKKILLTIRKELIKSRMQVLEMQKMSQGDVRESAEE